MTPLSPVWQACAAALKPGGALVVVMMHPAFRVPRQSDWVWQAEGDGGAQGRIVRQYLSSEKIEIKTHPGMERGAAGEAGGGAAGGEGFPTPPPRGIKKPGGGGGGGGGI